MEESSSCIHVLRSCLACFFRVLLLCVGVLASVPLFDEGEGGGGDPGAFGCCRGGTQVGGRCLGEAGGEVGAVSS